MRTFEFLLILANLLSLLLGIKRSQRAVWLAAAGVNLSLLFLHGMLEGWRYQMAFAYLLTVLFTLYAFAKTNLRFHRARMPLALKIIVTALALLGLGLTALLAVALPVFTLPKPSGEHAVGVQYFHWVDDQRPDPFLDRSPRQRELMVKVYYPAQPDGAKPYSPYFHGSRKLLRAFAAFYGMPEFAFDHLALVKTHSKEGLALADGQPAYPVILFSHGAGTSMEVQTAQSVDLASHGYIVVTIDHTYASAATDFPDRLVSHKEATTDFKTPKPAEIITQIMADDARFVLDQLGELNDGSLPSIFAGRLDLEHTGAIGHSVGGAVAYNLAIHEPRVRAAIDLDGVVFITPPEGVEIAPFLMLASDTYHAQAIQNRENLMRKLADVPDEGREFLLSIYGGEAGYQAAYDKAQQNLLGLVEVLQSSGNLYTIAGSDHMKFTDLGLFIGLQPLRELINIRGAADPAKCLEITEAVTLAFFDQHLKGESDTLAEVGERYAELKRVELGR